MNKMSLWLEEKLLPIGVKVNSIKFLRVVRESMMPTIPFIIVGSMVLIILNFPFIDKVVPPEGMAFISDVLSPLTRTTMSLIALFLAFLVGYNYVSDTVDNKANPIYCGLTTLIGFFSLTPFTVTQGEEIVESVIPTSYMGSSGMFIALVSAYFIAKLYCFIFNKGIKIRMPDAVPPNVMSSFEALIPAGITLVAVCIVNYLFTLTPYGHIHEAFTTILEKPLLAIGTGLPAILIGQTLAQLLWFLGIHGDQIVGSVMDPILQAASLKNADAFQAGSELPFIITDQFRALFMVIGFMSLVIAILIVARSSHLKSIGKVSALPAMFCISEPVLFGLPVVMNVTLFIPWILVRPVFGVITYVFMYFGLCPYPTGAVVPWTTPPLLSGFLATNSIMGAVVQLICLIVGVLMFIPFVKIIDNNFRKEENLREKQIQESKENQ